jgi:hypothetical protein
MRSAIYNIPLNDGCTRAAALCRELGVERVTLDPIRSQVVVCYRAGLTDGGRLRRSMQPPIAARATRWITWWSRLARIPGALARLV